MEGEALDLFLSLSPSQQRNLREIEDIFDSHFRPVAQGYLGVSEFLKLRKGPRETVSEYYLRVRKCSDRQKFAPDIVKVAFMQGLPIEYQKHLVLRKDLMALDDIFKASLDFEQASVLEQMRPGPRSNVVGISEEGGLEGKFDRMMEEVKSLRQEVQQARTRETENRETGPTNFWTEWF